MYTVIVKEDGWLYVVREPTLRERYSYIRNGYVAPSLVRENNSRNYKYTRGETKPNYPMPAIPLELEYMHNLLTHECIAVAAFEMNNNIPKCVLFIP